VDLEQARTIVDAAHEAFVAMDAEGRITYWNPMAEATFGWTRREAVGRVLADTIIPPAHREAHRAGLRRFLDTGEHAVLGKRLEIDALHRDGRVFPIELTISHQLLDGEHAFHAFMHDISERKRIEHEREELLARVEAIARTDELTGLPNRRAWDEDLRLELARGRRQDHAVCVAMIDLDFFKDYNDERGHQAGDALLQEAATAWRMQLRVTDVLARYGGEEFAVLLPDCPPHQALKVIGRLRGTTPERQTCSAGVAYWDRAESADALVGRADAALYEAKRSGRDRAVTASLMPMAQE
jgi:diguanylate cyclase